MKKGTKKKGKTESQVAQTISLIGVVGNHSASLLKGEDFVCVFMIFIYLCFYFLFFL